MKGAPDDLKIEENGALLKRIWIRPSKLTPPKEYWPVLAPKSLINAILQMFHGNDSLLGHSGRHKTYSTLRERFTWRGMSFALANGFAHVITAWAERVYLLNTGDIISMKRHKLL